MNVHDGDAVTEILSEHGLEALLPVRWLARRLGCTVWRCELRTAAGDASAHVQVYAVAAEPECIVNLEEELTALSDPASQRVVARQIRGDKYAILITCAAEDAAVFARFFERGEKQERELTYHPQLDRILGGDYFHQLQSHWLKACMASLPRAMTLKDLAEKSQAAYAESPVWPRKRERPTPQLLAVLEIPPVPIAGAPPDYQSLALTQWIIESPAVLHHQSIANAREHEDFSRQLFGFLASQHRAGLCFSRGHGCCLRPEFLLASGCLTDLYFMDAPPAGPARRQAMHTDLANALLVTGEMAAPNPAAQSDVLALALQHYAGGNEPRAELRPLIRHATQGLAEQKTEALGTLVTAVLDRSGDAD